MVGSAYLFVRQKYSLRRVADVWSEWLDDEKAIAGNNKTQMINLFKRALNDFLCEFLNIDWPFFLKKILSLHSNINIRSTFPRHSALKWGLHRERGNCQSSENHE